MWWIADVADWTDAATAISGMGDSDVPACPRRRATAAKTLEALTRMRAVDVLLMVWAASEEHPDAPRGRPVAGGFGRYHHPVLPKSSRLRERPAKNVDAM